MVEHSFGGDWTREKLERVEKYLRAYTKIFHANERAQYLSTVYVDGFAGTGYITPRESSLAEPSLFSDLAEPEPQSFLKGSAQIALDITPPFDHHVFIEKEQKYADELNRLRLSRYEDRGKIEIVNQEANQFLTEWCSRQNWKRQRAVVFLDPYSLEVEWNTLQALAATQGVDLWLLWPIGQAVNRLLTKKSLPPPSWCKTLDRVFGTDEWRARFYETKADTQLRLFGENMPGTEKVASFAEIEQFFLERLATLFAHVAQNPRYLFNSQGTPLFLLCFAAHHEKAVGIAEDILRT